MKWQVHLLGNNCSPTIKVYNSLRSIGLLKRSHSASRRRCRMKVYALSGATL